MRRTRRRRSTSSWVSPGPRVPIPPACWLKRAAPAPQAGQPVAQQGQLDLGLALVGAGVLGEDVEDHRGPVDGRAAQDLLEVALLGRRELVVEDDGVGVDGQGHRLELLGLAPADVGGRIGVVRRWTTRPTTSAPAVSTSRASSSRPASVAAGVPRGRSPRPSTMRSRTVAGDQGVGERRVVRAHRVDRSAHVERSPSRPDRPSSRTGRRRPPRPPSGRARQGDPSAAKVDLEGAARDCGRRRGRPPGPSCGRRRPRRRRRCRRPGSRPPRAPRPAW